MKKEEYSYGIIYDNIKNKKAAIKEIEGKCPCCGSNDNLIISNNTKGKFNQMIYECNCGTKWRGNFYDENEEVVSYKDIKKAEKKEKREFMFFKISDFFSDYWTCILAAIAGLILIFFMIFLLAHAFKTIEDSEQKYETTIVVESENTEKIKNENLFSEQKLEEMNEKTKDEKTTETTDNFETTQGSIEEIEELFEMILRLVTPLFIMSTALLLVRYILGPRY